MPEATSQQEEKTTGRRDKAPTSEMTVKDCIIWDHSGDKKEETPREYQHKFLIKKGEVGKSQDRGYTVPRWVAFIGFDADNTTANLTM